MTAPNGAAHTESPLALALVGARWLIGPCVDKGDGRVVLHDPGVYLGIVQVQRSATERGKVDVGIQRAVTPLDALTSLRSVTVFPSAVIDVRELSTREQKEIAQAYGAHLELLGNLRREVSVAPSLLIGGRS